MRTTSCRILFFSLLAVAAITKAIAQQRINHELSPSIEVTSFQISPDGCRVAYQTNAARGGEIYSVLLAGGSAIRIVEWPAAANQGYRIMPDGNSVLYPQGQSVYNVPVLGGEADRIPLLVGFDPTTGTTLDVSLPTITPDGETLVYYPSLFGELYSIPIAGGEFTYLVNGSAAPGGDLLTLQSDWQISPDGHSLIYRADGDRFALPELYRVPMDSGESSPVATRINLPSEWPNFYSVNSFRISPDSNTVVYHRGGDLYRYNMNDGSVVQLTQNQGVQSGGGLLFRDSGYQITPDSTTIVYRADQDEDEVFELYRMPLGGGASTKISGPLVENGDVRDFRISGDGTFVVYRADQDVHEVVELYSVPIVGGESNRLNSPDQILTEGVLGSNVLTTSDGTGRRNKTYEISPDGNLVVYLAEQNTEGVSELFEVPITGGATTKINGALPAGGEVESFQISPDSSTVLYLADQDTDNTTELYSVTISGEPPECNDDPVAQAASNSATAAPNAELVPGIGQLAFNLRWEEIEDPDRIITGIITFPEDAIANPPQIIAGIVPGSNLAINFNGQTFSYPWLGYRAYFRANSEIDFSRELVGQITDFNILTDNFDGIGPNTLRTPDGTYVLSSMAPVRISGQLIASDPDNNNATLTYTLDDPVAGLSINADGSYVFNPSNPAYTALAEGETLEVVANWSVTDEQGGIDSSTLTITITGANDSPVVEAAVNTATATSTPNTPGEELAFNLRWEGGIEDPSRIVTGSINFPEGTVSNPPSVLTNLAGSSLVIRFQGQAFSYDEPRMYFRANSEVDFSTELVGQISDFNIFTDDFVGIAPNALRTPDGIYNLVSMAPGISGQLIANDPDNNATLTYSLDAPVAGLSINVDGSYTFDPSDPAYTSLPEGEILEIVANWSVTDDEGATTSSTLTITVTGTSVSAPEILNLVANTTPQGIQSFTVTFSSRFGEVYSIERSRNLINWQDLAEIYGKENSTEFTDEDPVLDGDPAFYRVRKNNP